jgi:hypothetical protein
MNGKQMAQRIATTTIPMMVCSESDWLVAALLFTLVRSLSMVVMVTVPTMHKHMNQRTSKQYQPGQSTKQMDLVLPPE